MLRVGLKPTIPVFQRAKTFHVIDSAATVIDPLLASVWELFQYSVDVIAPVAGVLKLFLFTDR
jgi:hypothetical protein